MGDPGCFDSGSVYALERHFPLRWRRGVAAGDCARGSRIGRRLFRREDSTCARWTVRTASPGRRFETLFETAVSVHEGSHKQPQNRTDSHRRTRTSTKPNTARDAAAGSRATAIGARRGASLALPAAGMYTRDFYHIRALSVSTSQNWNSSAQAVTFAMAERQSDEGRP